LAPAGIDSAPVLEFKGPVITKKIGRTDGTIGLSDILSIVEEIGKVVALFESDALHVLKTVLGVILGVVRHDGYGMDAEAMKIAGVTNESVLDGLNVGAVVRDEHHQKALGSFAVSEC
jgi:hypothetical protein